MLGCDVTEWDAWLWCDSVVVVVVVFIHCILSTVTFIMNTVLNMVVWKNKQSMSYTGYVST